MDIKDNLLKGEELSFELGWSSAKSKIPTSFNPYCNEGARYDAWLAGWVSYHQINDDRYEPND